MTRTEVERGLHSLVCPCSGRCAYERIIARAVDAGIQFGREQEREAVVAWLHHIVEPRLARARKSTSVIDLCREIECGAHCAPDDKETPP